MQSSKIWGGMPVRKLTQAPSRHLHQLLFYLAKNVVSAGILRTHICTIEKVANHFTREGSSGWFEELPCEIFPINVGQGDPVIWTMTTCHRQLILPSSSLQLSSVISIFETLTTLCENLYMSDVHYKNSFRSNSGRKQLILCDEQQRSKWKKNAIWIFGKSTNCLLFEECIYDFSFKSLIFGSVDYVIQESYALVH